MHRRDGQVGRRTGAAPARCVPRCRRRRLRRCGLRVAAVAPGRSSAAVDLELLHPARIGIENFDLERAGTGHELAPHRHAADPGRDIAGERVDFLGDLADIEFGADEREATSSRLARASARNEPSGWRTTPGRCPRRARRRYRRRSARRCPRSRRRRRRRHIRRPRATRWMRVACILASRSITGIDGGTNRISRTIFVADSGIARSIALRSRPAGNGFLRRVLALALAAARAVMKATRSRMWTMPIGVVERLVIDHEPRMAGALEHLHEFAERDVPLHRDDVGARNHDILDPPLAQREDVLEHGASRAGRSRARRRRPPARP